MGAELDGYDFSWADLRNVNFSWANLHQTRFHRALLGQTSFRTKAMIGAGFTGAVLLYAAFLDIDLSWSIGLDRVEYKGPSHIGVDTIYASYGQIPESFLRGAGVPDTMIAFAKSLAARPIEFYSCFISYSTADKLFAEHLYADLQNRGVRCWFAPEDLKIGAELRLTFDEAIRMRDKLLLILSDASIHSGWVKREVERALEEEQRRHQDGREDGKVLFPIRLDDSIFEVDTGWVTDVKRRHIGDFRNWKDHDSYQKAFWPLSTSVVLLTGFRHVLSIPSELAANWIFRLNESHGRRDWMQAVERFVILYAVAPIYLLLFPVAVASLGLGLALRMTTLQVLVSLTIFEVLFQSWQQLPFTCSNVPGKRPPVAILGGYIAALGIGVPLLSMIIRGGSQFTGVFVIYFTFFLAAWLFARRGRREGWGEARLVYEDLPWDVPNLGIAEMSYGARVIHPAPADEPHLRALRRCYRASTYRAATVRE